MSSASIPKLPKWPKQITIVNTTLCNLNCFMCFVNGPLVKNVRRTMPMSLVSRVIREAGPHVEAISFTNWGEPFCDPNLPKILAELANFPNVTILFQTNGLLLDAEHLQFLKGLPNPIRFNISVDTLDPVVYASIRPPGELRILIDNLLNLRKNAAQIGFKIEFIELNSTLSLRNIACAPRLVEFASLMGANGVRLLHIGAIHPSLKNESLYRVPVYTNKVLSRCRELAEEHSIVLNCAQMFAVTEDEIKQTKPEIRMCDMIDSMVQISPDGEVWPCCGDLPLIGKLEGDANLSEIWGNQSHERLRAGIWHGAPIGACKSCRYLERLTPYLYDSNLVGFDMSPDERCMDEQPDFEALGAVKWLDEVPEQRLRNSVRSGLLTAAEHAHVQYTPHPKPLFQRVEAFLVRWARNQPYIMNNPRLVRRLGLAWEVVRRSIRRLGSNS